MPKFGELLATNVWAAAARTLTDISVEEIFDLPAVDDLYGEIKPASSAVANTFGSWVEISADVGVGKRLLYALLAPKDSSNSKYAVFEFGEGESGSESAIASVHFPAGSASHLVSTTPIFRSLTDNARLSVRVKDDASFPDDFWIGVQVA